MQEDGFSQQNPNQIDSGQPVVGGVVRPQDMSSTQSDMQQPPFPSQQIAEAELPQDIVASWEADEFLMDSPKDSAWYGAMVLGSMALAAIVYLLNKDILTSVLVLVGLVGLAYFSGRKPRRQRFMVTNDGIQIGGKVYLFKDMSSFSANEDRSGVDLVIVPSKRFMPAIHVNVPAELSEQIVSYVGSFLPNEQKKDDFVDKLSKRLKF